MPETYTITLLLVFAAVMFLILRITSRRLPAIGEKAEMARLVGRTEEKGETEPTNPHGGVPGVNREDDLNGFAREIEGRIDTKIAHLKALIGEAQKVESLLADRIQAATGAGLTAPSRPGDAEDSDDGGGRAEEDGSAETKLGARVDVKVGEDPGSGEKSANGKILRLYRAGREAPAIAEEVGLPRGEVELIINLHSSQKEPPETRG